MSSLRATRDRRRLGRDRRGSTAVEFALLAWPIVMLVIGGIQLAIYQYTQLMLSNALFDTAASPGTEVLTGDQDGYKTLVCASIRIMPAATCKAKILVEMAPLINVPTAAQSVQGTFFLPGVPMNLMLLRAAIPAVKILPLLPAIWAKSSVVFRRS